MPSSLFDGPRQRSLSAGDLNDAFRGQKFRMVPDFFVSVPNFAAAALTGATSGFWVFVAEKPMTFLGGNILWEVAGTNTARVKKVLAATAGAPGAAADANHVDISAAIDLTGTADTVFPITPVVSSYVCHLETGDKVAIASAAGTASLVGATAILQFVWD